MKIFLAGALRTALVMGALALTLSCAGSGSGTADCADGIDNDGDGLIDGEDPGCQVNGQEVLDPEYPACSDGADNDGDGLVDLEDPGCLSPDDDSEHNEPVPQCQDGIDNDGDGLIDYPNDPGCFTGHDNDESDECPNGRCPRCSNGIDDDGDGLIDYPADPGCDAAMDDDEYNPSPGECGGDVHVAGMPSNGEASGSAVAQGNNELVSGSCGGSGQETVFTLTVHERTALHLTTNFPETTLDTVIYVRSDCRKLSSEVGCNDDTDGKTSELMVEVDPGLYYIIVDAHDAGAAGNFKLQVTQYTPQGEACDPDAPACSPGLVCRHLDGNATEETCELPECADGLDNDEDGFIDFPYDPGCVDLDDNDEGDSCPDGEDCPQCGNGVDDDGDGLIDYPNDPGCKDASDDSEIDECIPGVEVNTLIPAGVSGTTSGSGSFSGSCSWSNYPEDVWSLDLDRTLKSLSFSTVGSTMDPSLYVRYGSCADSAAEIACANQTGGGVLTVNDPQPGTYFVFVDGYYSSGNYVLSASGVIAGGDSCDPTDSLFVCEAGYACVVDTCEPAACNDGLDNDEDGLTDYPNDPGCESTSDDSEDDDCPDGASCPQCSNGIDDDEDGIIDYPDDLGCSSAADDDETNCDGESDPIGELALPSVSGTTTGLTHDFTQSCTSGTAPEKVYVLTFPGKLKSLVLDTIGSNFDTVLYIKEGTCGAADLACDDQGGGNNTSKITLSEVEAGTYMIFVDGWLSNHGNYVLNVKGVIKSGEACKPSQIATGLMACDAGTTCTPSGPGHTCQ